jgi:hypothetical protein
MCIGASSSNARHFSAFRQEHLNILGMYDYRGGRIRRHCPRQEELRYSRHRALVASSNGGGLARRTMDLDRFGAFVVNDGVVGAKKKVCKQRSYSITTHYTRKNRECMSDNSVIKL